ncbi:MAG: dihydrolipoyl dehydrogenase [Acidobacteriota bacterium]|nr:MAG: dihydrolipoyl dehydrogenase [Acidobacteriota bacterium]
MTEKRHETDLVVIGGGPGGYAAAFHAAQLDLKVTLIDIRENPGGVCLNVGCIPSKALLHAAEILDEARHAEEIGLSFSAPKIDLDKLRSWKEKVVSQLTGGLGQLAKQHEIRYIQGSARFKDPHTLSIEGGDVDEVSFRHAIIATGSRPSTVPGLDLDSERLMDSTGALELVDIPKTLLVVGGGYIGLELGTVYAALGTKVTVVELLDGLLPGADRDLVRPLAKRVKETFEAVHLKTKVVSMTDVKKGIKVKFEGAVNEEQTFERVLVSVGRTPNSEGLGLENISVRVAANGFIEIDRQCRTSEPHIFAIGDVAGQPMLAHKAMREGKVAAEVIAGRNSAFDNQAIPAVVFTNPEVAWAGIMETEAKQKGIDVQVVRFPWAACGRALTLGRTDGMTKMVVEPESGRILGVGIVGPNAGELIAEGTLAIEMGAVAEDLALTIHTHPTLSETVGEVAELFLGHATHIYRK